MTQYTSRAGGLMETLGGVSDFSIKPESTSLFSKLDKLNEAVNESYRGKVQELIMDLLTNEYKDMELSVDSLSRSSALMGVDYGTLMKGYEALEKKHYITVRTIKGVDTFLKLATKGESIDRELSEKILPDFTTNAEMIDFLRAGIPAKLHKNGHIYISSKDSFGDGTITVKFVSDDYMENPRLNKIEHNAMHRFIFMMHETPEDPKVRQPLKFEVVTGVSFMNKHLLKNPRFMKQQTFRAAAQKLIDWFSKNQAALLNWSDNL